MPQEVLIPCLKDQLVSAHMFGFLQFREQKHFVLFFQPVLVGLNVEWGANGRFGTKNSTFLRLSDHFLVADATSIFAS